MSNIYIGAYCKTETKYEDTPYEEKVCPPCNVFTRGKQDDYCSQCGQKMLLKNKTRKTIVDATKGLNDAPGQKASFNRNTYYFSSDDAGHLYMDDNCNDLCSDAISILELTKALTDFEKRYVDFWQHLKDNNITFSLTAGVLIY